MDTSALVLGLRVVLALAVVLGLLWWLARRTGGGRARAKVTTVSVVGRQSLGRRSGVAVVEVEGRRLLLGVTDQGVTLLAELAAAADEPPAQRVEIDPLDLARMVGDLDLDLDDADDADDLDDAPASPATRTCPTDDVRRSASHPSTPAARTPAVPTPRNPLEGSILAPSTWRQAVVAVQERTIRR